MAAARVLKKLFVSLEAAESGLRLATDDRGLNGKMFDTADAAPESNSECEISIEVNHVTGHGNSTSI
jgi:hypothetical protein